MGIAAAQAVEDAEHAAEGGAELVELGPASWAWPFGLAVTGVLMRSSLGPERLDGRLGVRGRAAELGARVLCAQQHHARDQPERGHPERPPVGGVEGVRQVSVEGEIPLARWSTTASTAVPIAPPMRCSTFSCGVASES